MSGAQTFEHLVTGGEPIAKVTFTFEADGVAEAWRVHALRIEEALSVPYAADLSLVSEDSDARPSDLLGKSCAFTMRRDDLARRLSGIVLHVEHLGFRKAHVLSKVTVGPCLAALAHQGGPRMFQKMTIPEILQKVLQEGLDPYHRTVRLELQRAYPKREYCLQFGESDLQFVSRLLAEEGIFFWFDQSGNHETMVLTDGNGTCQPFSPQDPSVAMVGPGAGLASTEALRRFVWTEELRPNSITLRDFDWTRPALDLTTNRKGPGAGGGPTREVYRYAPPLTLSRYDDGAGRYAVDDGRDKTLVRFQAQTAQEQIGSGDGYVTRFTVGTTFDLVGHSPELDLRYLITGVTHQGDAPEELGDFGLEGVRTGPPGGAPSVGERYWNRFTCIPADVPFRPAQQPPRPRVPGLQSGLVVGPPGEEIHTDMHGRIRVRFPWDREAAGDETSSCWIRVAQVWSGPGWGFSFVPRIGMEVLVAFMDGDPDKPL